MKSIATITEGIMARFEAAEQKPRKRCANCGKPEALDLEWNDPPLCEPCMTAAEGKTAEQQRIEAFTLRREQSRLPRNYWAARYTDFAECPDPRYTKHQQGVARAVFECAKSRTGKGILLIGPSGTGKTHLLAAAANQMLVNQPILWLDSYALKRELANDTFARPKDDAEPRQPFGQRVAEAYSAVVLDEFTFDKSVDYGWLQDGFMGFLNDLTAYGRVNLFMSSNNPLGKPLTDPVTKQPDRSDGLPQLDHLFKERGTSRLMQLVTPIHMTGPNRRLATQS